MLSAAQAFSWSESKSVHLSLHGSSDILHYILHTLSFQIPLQYYETAPLGFMGKRIDSAPWLQAPLWIFHRRAKLESPHQLGIPPLGSWGGQTVWKRRDGRAAGKLSRSPADHQGWRPGDRTWDLWLCSINQYRNTQKETATEANTNLGKSSP